MSVSEQLEMKCPQCGAQQKVTVWKTLDIKADPAAKDALFAWEINVFLCSQCDFRAQMPVSLLYHDADRQFGIQYYPMDSLGSEPFYEQFGRDGEHFAENGSDELPAYLRKPHIVFDMAEMMRYIVFREVAFEKGRR